MAESAKYVFLPWVRQGAASGIQTPDRSPGQAGVVSVTAKLRVNNTEDIDTENIVRQVRLYGPGDVTGIDPQQVIRTEPRHVSLNFEPNYFPAIEFDRPDFPWLFTPAKADDAGKLRPWLCLVVVRKQEGVTLRAEGNLPLPILEIKGPAKPGNELPDLSESWAWAHSQISGSMRDKTSLQDALKRDPAMTLSRLLCPRRLDPLTDYLACVVPTFELGCKAGLGFPISSEDEKQLNLSWASGPQSPDIVTLPVYFHWEFRTGTGGDFEALVKLLKAVDLRETPNIGTREMDISQPGFINLPAGTTLELEGALRVLGTPVAQWSMETRAPFQAELKSILDAPWQAIQDVDEDNDPVVAPPIYGCWQAARHIVDIPVDPLVSSTWLDELNLDPRHRAVAALGTQVVQTEQEQLMASAWEQLGEIERSNQIRRQAQLARAVNTVYYTKHFTRFSDETLLKVVSGAQSRIVVKTIDHPTALLSQRISDSALPNRAFSAPLRRMTSARGMISTRFRTTGAPPMTLLAQLNTPVSPFAFLKFDTGLVLLNHVAEREPGLAAQLKDTVRFERTTNALETAPQLGDFTIIPEGRVRSLLDFQPGLPDSADAVAFRNAAKAHNAYLVQNAFMSFKDSPPAQSIQVSELTKSLLQTVNPERTINIRVQASLRIAGDTAPTADPLKPILDEPDFPQPMYEALRDLSQDFLFPGLEHVPPNTVSLLMTNPKFVESFLVGLNNEMSHELLWRNYPTDQRGTYFRQFWDTSVDKGEPDVKPINEWGESQLGDNMPRASGNLVLLIRGELLRRYPNSVIYAVPAVKKQNGELALSPDQEAELTPLFRGTLKPDVTFLGFDLTDAKARGDAPHDPNGWFFVIQQQPTEPRFGMDEANFIGPVPHITTNWNNLSWRHLANAEQELKELSHASLDSIKRVLPDVDKEKIDNAQWGKNSSHQAYITLQRPVRIAIHATEMIKQ